jgi:hypothetical protein
MNKAIRKLLELPDKWLDVIKDDGSIVEYVSAWEAQVRNKCANELQSALDAADIEGLVERVEQLEKALKPFCHPDFRRLLSGNVQGLNSPVFGRDRAYLTIGDFVQANDAITGER